MVTGQGGRLYLVLGLLAACGVLGQATRASAFCRSSTETEPSGLCEESPDAVFLTWRRTCITYSFHDRFFDRMEALQEDEVRTIVDTSFRTWMDVACESGPFVALQAEDLTDANPVQFLFDAPNTAVMSALTRAEWSELDQPPSAFAITFLWHNKRTGEIYDVDMALNLRHGPFTDCENGCPADGRVDLQNTITHEAGHVFGLGHSSVDGATMRFDAQAGQTFMRDLEPDDEEGVCALELPSHGCGPGDACMCPAPPIIPAVIRTGGGCCAVAGRPRRGTLGAGAAALAVLALSVRLRRRPRPGPRDVRR